MGITLSSLRRITHQLVVLSEQAPMVPSIATPPGFVVLRERTQEEARRWARNRLKHKRGEP